MNQHIHFVPYLNRAFGDLKVIKQDELKTKQLGLGRYEGQMVEEKIQGFGTFFYNDGEQYEGEFIDGKFQGHGTYFWTDGDKYIGQFSDDQRTGFGIFYSNANDPNESKAEANKNKFSSVEKGQKAKYIGDVLDSLFTGHGTEFYQNGDRYEGEFLNDLKHGPGTLYRKNGQIETGHWLNGNRI
jgi:hypothetical protein